MIAAVDPGQPGWPAISGRSNADTSALRDAGIAVNDDLIVTVDWGGSEGADAMAKLLGLLSCHRRLCSLRRSRPRTTEPSAGRVSGYRNTSRSSASITIPSPSSPTIAPSVTVYEQGVPAAQMVLGLLRGEDVEQAIILPTQLVIRRSTAPPRR